MWDPSLVARAVKVWINEPRQKLHRKQRRLYLFLGSWSKAPWLR